MNRSGMSERRMIYIIKYIYSSAIIVEKVEPFKKDIIEFVYIYSNKLSNRAIKYVVHNN